MSEIDKMARELLAAGWRKLPEYAGAADDLESGCELPPVVGMAVDAIRAALLTAPTGWKLVPIPPTDDMIEAAQDAHMPFGDMHFAITSAILAAPEPK